MATCHLTYWTSPRGDLARIYVNTAEGDTAGYLEQREFGEYTSRWSHTLAADVMAALVTAAGVAGDAGQQFVCLKRFARGVKWSCPAAQKKALKKLADDFTFTS